MNFRTSCKILFVFLSSFFVTKCISLAALVETKVLALLKCPAEMIAVSNENLIDFFSDHSEKFFSH